VKTKLFRILLIFLICLGAAWGWDAYRNHKDRQFYESFKARYEQKINIYSNVVEVQKLLIDGQQQVITTQGKIISSYLEESTKKNKWNWL
jgi:hypothetical protein